MVFLKTKPFVKRNNAEFTNIPSFTSYVQHTLYTALQDTSFFHPTTNNFFKFVYSEITGESAWRVLFRTPSLAIEGHQNLTHFSCGVLISRTFLTHTRSSCTLLCLYLAFCTQKMRWRAQFSRYGVVSAEETILIGRISDVVRSGCGSNTIA